MKKVFLMAFAFAVLSASEAQAQGILGRIKDKVKEKVTEKIDRTIDQTIDGVLNGKPAKANKAEAVAAGKDDDVQNNIESSKSDFVRGSVIVFQDDMKGEKVGEFPSKWDLVRGNAEIAKINGEYCIAMEKDDSWIAPLIKNGNKNYLGKIFTVEFDMLYDDRSQDGSSSIELDFMAPDHREDDEIYTFKWNNACDAQDVLCDYVRTGSDSFSDKQGSSRTSIGVVGDGKWHHFAVSFNERALKFYVDGKRVINVPAAKAGAGWVTFWSAAPHPTYLKNVIIAHGAGELYDRNATDASADAIAKAIQQTGKFVTNNILFETGKADLKSESMIEIMKVADYMKKNPNARFEVVGHTDNQGSDKVNDPLSQKRAEAIVKALEGLGVDGFNLKATGKGSHEPVADNKTEAGRAKNRRVEFVLK